MDTPSEAFLHTNGDDPEAERIQTRRAHSIKDCGGEGGKRGARLGRGGVAYAACRRNSRPVCGFRAGGVVLGEWWCVVVRGWGKKSRIGKSIVWLGLPFALSSAGMAIAVPWKERAESPGTGAWGVELGWLGVPRCRGSAALAMRGMDRGKLVPPSEALSTFRLRQNPSRDSNLTPTSSGHDLAFSSRIGRWLGTAGTEALRIWVSLFFHALSRPSSPGPQSRRGPVIHHASSLAARAWPRVLLLQLAAS